MIYQDWCAHICIHILQVHLCIYRFSNFISGFHNKPVSLEKKKTLLMLDTQGIVIGMARALLGQE